MGKVISVRLSPHLIKYLDKLALKLTYLGKPTTRSELIRQAIVEYLKKHLPMLMEEGKH